MPALRNKPEQRPEQPRKPAALLQQRINILFRYAIAALDQPKGPVYAAQYDEICDRDDKEKQRRRRCPDDAADLAIRDELSLSAFAVSATASEASTTTVECPSAKKKPTATGRFPSCINLRVTLSIAAIWSASMA